MLRRASRALTEIRTTALLESIGRPGHLLAGRQDLFGSETGARTVHR
jgi:hypothetical protein